MNSKLTNLSTEKLEKKLATMEKFKKVLNWVILIAIILTILSALIDNDIMTSISTLTLSLFLRFIIYPIQIGAIKTEINNRNNRNQDNISN